jgi:hypothetical protein
MIGALADVKWSDSAPFFSQQHTRQDAKINSKPEIRNSKQIRMIKKRKI